MYKCFVLNYIDRKGVKKSTKNFQLTDENLWPEFEKTEGKMKIFNKKRKILYQFAETKENGVYFLDYSFPFTPLEAFAIGISCIQKKLLC